MEGSLTSPRNNFYYEAVGPYKIEKKCYEASLCKHYVINTENGLYELMSGKEIYKIIKKYHVNIPHFNYLEGRVFKCCFFTFYKSF